MICKQLGISVYPGISDIVTCKKQIDRAVELGYTKVFTGFTCEADELKLTEDFIEIFRYAKEKHMEFHVDINNHVMKALGISSDNLKPVQDLGIPVIRVDCGISLEEIVEMTKNPYGIVIEENLSNLRTLREKMEAVKTNGNMLNYCACHNFYPRVNSGLDMEYALQCARIAKEYGCRTGAFIGSMYSEYPLTPNAKSTMTVEKHRYIPAQIQAMELFSTELFDFVMFGDSNPRDDELIAVSRTTRSAYDCLEESERRELKQEQKEEYQSLYCIQIPVYLDTSLKELKEKLTKLVMRNRIDVCDEAVRIMNWREKLSIEPILTLPRHRYCLTLDNVTSGTYRGEIEILLKDMPAVPYANVVGMVKPYAADLVDLARSGKVMFQFTED